MAEPLQPSDDRPRSADAAGAGTPDDDRPTAKQSRAEQPTAEQPTAEQPTGEQPTPEQPTAEQPAPQPTEVIVVEEPAAPRRKRRWIGWVIALGVVVVVLVVGVILLDGFARQTAAAYVRERIIEVLRLEPDADVDVDLGSGSLLLQALAGRVSDVTVTVPQLTVGEVTGSAVLTATDVPLDQSQPLGSLGAVVTIPESQVRGLAGYLSGVELTGVELVPGAIDVSTELDLIFLTLPVTVGLVPTATGTGIAFTPDTITLDDQEISVDELRSNPLVASIAGTLLDSREFCLASSLPAALAVSDVAVSDDAIAVTIVSEPVALSDPRLSSNGSCP